MIRFFLRRRVLTNLMTLFIVALGIYQFTHVRRDAFPDVKFDLVTVTTLYPGASPQEVERLVTLPIEETLKTVNNVDKVESFSVEGRSLVLVWLQENMSSGDVTRAVNDVQQAVNRVDDLPDETIAPLVEEMTSDRPLITVSVSGGDEFARDRFAEQLKDRIEDIPDVSKIDPHGDRAREIWVEVNPAKLRAAQVTVGEISAALRDHNVNLSAGSLVSGKEELLVRTMGAFETADDVAAVIVRGNDERSFLRVRDVATVKETFTDAKLLARANGEPAINLMIRKKKTGDTLVLADEVKKVIAEVAPAAKAEGMTLTISEDFSFFVKRRLKVMTQNMMQGGVLIVIALFLFLDWRLALVAALGVPISFGAAMAVAVPLGFTINLMTLLAFIIVLGMLDDDSVVVAENIYRHLEMGKPPMQAALDGTHEVILPVLGSVAATSAAFLPFALTSGIMGKFLFMIPVIIIMCFVASVFEAFFILPAHVLDLMPFGKPVAERAEGHWYVRVRDLYRSALGWCVSHRYWFVGIAMLFSGVTAAAASWRLKLVMFPEGLIDQFFVQIEMPRGYALPETQKALAAVEARILKLSAEELEALTSEVGQTGYEESVRQGTHFAQARVFLTPQENRKRKTDEIITELRADFAQVPEIQKLTIEKLRPGPPVGAAFQARVRGDDPAVLGQIADKMKAALDAIDGVADIRDNFEGGKNELQVRVNSREAAYAGVSTAQVARHILNFYEGGEVTKIRRPTEEVVVKVKLAEPFRSDPDAFNSLLVLNNRGQQVNLGRLIRTETQPGPPFIQRYNFKRTITVTASVDNVKATSFAVNSAIRKQFANLASEYPGTDVVFGGEEEETQKSMKSLARGFIVAILLDLIILATLFNSYAQPLIILLTIPIGLTGVAWALILHNEPASFMGLLGAVAMTGVVVNNAIVLVDFINNERAAGKPIQQAVVDAGATRLRPIFASSVTTLLGLFPTAYGIGGYEPFVAPMCLSLAWGLALAMPMTLFVIPMATLMADDLKQGFDRFMRRVFRRPAPITPTNH